MSLKYWESIVEFYHKKKNTIKYNFNFEINFGKVRKNTKLDLTIFWNRMAEAPPTILEMSKVYKAILDSTQEITRYLRYKSSKNFFSFF